MTDSAIRETARSRIATECSATNSRAQRSASGALSKAARIDARNSRPTG
jgi:hypothetical protein